MQSMDLLLPVHRDLDRSEYPLEGLCHPLSQALSCGDIVDLISHPHLLLDDEDYDAAEPIRWRPSLPAKRTRTLLARAGLTLPAAGSARVRRGTRPRRRAPVARRRNT